MDSRRKNIIDPHVSNEPVIGQWLWAMQDARSRTMEVLEGIVNASIDWQPPDNESSIGTSLYHIAAIEADWLYVEVLEHPFPPEVVALFPDDVRDSHGQLTHVQWIAYTSHLQRLETVRSRLLEAFQQMTLTEFRRVRSFPAYDVTPEWVLHHLLQHEAEHRSQIGAVRARAERALAT